MTRTCKDGSPCLDPDAPACACAAIPQLGRLARKHPGHLDALRRLNRGGGGVEAPEDPRAPLVLGCDYRGPVVEPGAPGCGCGASRVCWRDGNRLVLHGDCLACVSAGPG